jgi:RHS repeat-associated protein
MGAQVRGDPVHLTPNESQQTQEQQKTTASASKPGSSGYSSVTGNWSTHNFYHADGNGNITYLVNSSQGLGADYRYDPFGNLIVSGGSEASANVYRFSSKEVHVNSGMYCYLYRFYDPNLQRWLNRDVIGDLGFRAAHSIHSRYPELTLGDPDPQSLQQDYTYASNAPSNSVDPLGLRKYVDWYCLCIFAPPWTFVAALTPACAGSRAGSPSTRAPTGKAASSSSSSGEARS